MRRLVLVVVSAAACAGIGSLCGPGLTAFGRQAAQQVPGSFRSSITLVPLDVRVIDEHGKPVTGLKQEDFTVLEDDVRQQISHFSPYGLVPNPPPPGTPAETSISFRPALRRAPGSDPSPQNQRIFLIVLGRGRLQEPSKGLDALLDFVRHDLLPQDHVAVLAYNRATDFTTDHGRIAEVLDRFRRMNDDVEGKISFALSDLNAVYGSRDLPKEVQGLIDRVFDQGSGASGRGSGAPEVRSRDVLPVAIPEIRRIEEDARRTIGDLMSSGNNMQTDLPFEEFVAENARTMQDLGNVYAAIEYMRWLEGEKHLIYVTEKGLFLPRADDDERLAAAANSARVSIDTLQTGGIWAGQIGGNLVSPGSWTQLFAYMALRNISRLSGGVASITEYARVGLNRIDETTRTGYFIGYYPAAVADRGAAGGRESRPGSSAGTPQSRLGKMRPPKDEYRKITIKVNRPHVTVLYRHGYFATDVVVPTDRRTFLTFNRMISAAAYQREVRDIKVKISTSVGTHPGTTEREVQAEIRIDTSRLAWQHPEAATDARHTAQLELVAFTVREDGRIDDERWQTVTLDMEEQEYQRALREGIRVRSALPWTGKIKSVKVVVYDYEADLIGTAVATVVF